MTILQKLFWFTQMGIESFCSEVKHVPATKVEPPSVSEKKVLMSSRSSLSKTATHTLHGTGVIPAKVLCILNAPNSEEDRTGVCLVGPEGEMTKKMLTSIDLDITKNTYMTYLSPWRPPGNRLLTQVEIKEGLEILDKCISQVKPTYLFVLGTETLRALIRGKTLSSLRTSHSTYHDYPVYATFSAADLIKNPNHRRQAWEDLKNFKEKIQGE